MPKMKTNRAAAKRFRRTGTGNAKRGCANRRHILTKKTTERKRRLRAGAMIHPSNMREIDMLLPNS